MVDSSVDGRGSVGMVSGKGRNWGKEGVFTGHVELEHLKSVLVHLESVQKALFCVLDILACGCHDWEIGRFEEAAGEFKPNAAGGRGCQDPRESHCGGDGLWRRVIQMAVMKSEADVMAAVKEKNKRRECHLSIEGGGGEWGMGNDVEDG